MLKLFIGGSQKNYNIIIKSNNKTYDFVVIRNG